jgi:hypothetical protein
MLAIGDDLYLQDKPNAANWGRYTLTALPTDNGTWVQFSALTYVGSGGVEPANNDDVGVSFLTQGPEIEQWWGGTGVPAATLGRAGDWYLDYGTGDVYEKLAAGWTKQANIKGPPGQGVPPGGTTGQALVKNTNTDYDVGFKTITIGYGGTVL